MLPPTERARNREIGVVLLWHDGQAMLILCLLFALPGIALALAGERAGNWKVVLLGKGVASAGFLVLAWSLMPGAHSPYAWWIFSSLGLSFAGDLFLVWRKGFLCGLVAFLLAHLGYLGAFVSLTEAGDWVLGIGLGILLVSLAILWWLWSRLRTMKPAVVLYVLVISLMVWGALSAWGASGTPGAATIAVAAVLFYVSDILVARQVFVRKSFLNPVLGLPLYYAAQYLFASSVGRL